MSHESERSGAAVAIAVAVALIVVVFGFILVAVAGLFVFRSVAVRNDAIVLEQQALQQQGMPVTASPVTAMLTITLDESGSIQLNGAAVDLDQLRQNLEGEKQRASDLQVIVAPVAECKTEHVTAVVSACLESGISDVQVRVQN